MKSYSRITMMLSATCMLALLVASDSGGQNAKQGVPTGDIRYKIKVTRAGHSSETTTMIKGQSKRTEQGDDHTFTIFQCDRTVKVNDLTKKYFVFQRLVTPIKPPATTPARRGGTVTETLTRTDLGERKQMFGYTAVHLKITFVKESAPDACDQQKIHWEEEGWYFDFDPEPKCTTDARIQPTCLDKIEIKHVGGATKVFPLIQTLTSYDAAGNAGSTTTTEVIELSTNPLDQSLFDIPPGYSEVKTLLELSR